MSPLTPDERAEVTAMLRERGLSVLHPDSNALALAAKLEAEPEPDAVVDACAEHVSRRLNPQAWEVIATMGAASREEHAEALRAEARFALATMPDPLRLVEPLREQLGENISGAPRLDVSVAGASPTETLRCALETAEESEERWKESAASAAIERDEAREALRELAEVAERVKELPDDLMVRLHLSLVLPKANEILEGVERTHTLVPNEQSGAAARTIAHFLSMRGRSLSDEEHDRLSALASALGAAARGEYVEWPS